MAEHRIRTASDDRGHPTTVVGGVRAAHYVYPAMEWVEPSRPESVLDRLGRVSDLAQLIVRYDSVLIARKLPSLPRHPSPFPSPLIRRLES